MNNNSFNGSLQDGQPVSRKEEPLVEQSFYAVEGHDTFNDTSDTKSIGEENPLQHQTESWKNSSTGPVEFDQSTFSYNKVVNALSLLNAPVDGTPRLWDPFLLKVGLVSLVGSSDVGKSSFLRQLAYAIASGQEYFLGYKLNCIRKRVLYVSTEDGFLDLVNALNKLKDGNSGLPMPEGLDFILDVDNNNKIFDVIDAYLTNKPADVVVIDAIIDIMRGNPNLQTDVRQMTNRLKWLANKHQCLLIMMQHTVKNAEKHAADKNQVNGSQAWEAAPRCVMMLKHKPETGERSLRFVKANYLGHEVKQTALLLDFDETTLCFSLKGTQSVGELIQTSRQKYNDDRVFIRLTELRSQGISYEKARLELVEEFGEANVPGLTSLKKIK